MNDTAPELEDRLGELFAQRSGGDRIRMMGEMFDLARVLMVGRIKAGNPAITPEDLRAEIFERT